MGKERCSKRVWCGYHTNPCIRNGSVQRNGRWYCWQHDPVAIKEHNNKREAKYKEIRDKENEIWRRRGAMRKACDGISTDDLEALAPGELAALLKSKEAPDETK